MIDRAGVYNLSHDAYHADPCIVPSLSRSVIKDLLFRSPLHAWFHHPRLNPNFVPTENGRFAIGTSCHSLLLEGVDNVLVVDAEDWRKKEAREARDLAMREGKTPLLKTQYEMALKTVDAAMEQIISCRELGIKDLRTDGEAELSFFWREEDTWNKTRTDWISKDRKLILDCKFTEMSANPADISRYILTMGLDIQAALYTRGAEKISGVKPKFVFVFCEIAEPYACSFVSLPPDFLALGKSKVEFGIYLWRECMSKNVWPAYPKQVCYPDLPPWGMAAWESRAEEMGVGK